MLGSGLVVTKYRSHDNANYLPLLLHEANCEVIVGVVSTVYIVAHHARLGVELRHPVDGVANAHAAVSGVPRACDVEFGHLARVEEHGHALIAPLYRLPLDG